MYIPVIELIKGNEVLEACVLCILYTVCKYLRFSTMIIVYIKISKCPQNVKYIVLLNKCRWLQSFKASKKKCFLEADGKFFLQRTFKLSETSNHKQDEPFNPPFVRLLLLKKIWLIHSKFLKTIFYRTSRNRLLLSFKRYFF